jgi:hypothetical protein
MHYDIVNTDSAIVNGDSEISLKIVHDQSESAFTFVQNCRSRWIRIRVHDQSEYANKSGNKLKCLYYEPNCFSLWYRRLEKGRFIFPKDKNGKIEITQDHFKWLLASDKYTQCGRISTYCEGYF